MTATESTRPTRAARERPLWRVVAIPSEHGGWGLTLEPVLLGILVARSIAGAALGTAAFLAFLVRTPLKLALVDVRRGRWLDRSRLAARIAAVELVVIAALVAVACTRTSWSWAVPVAVAAPLVGIELWFDLRSRGRRLVPELCGAVGIAAVVAVIVLAAGRSGRLAAALWLVLAARSIGAIPFVRGQIARLRRGTVARGIPRLGISSSDAAQWCALIVAGTGLLVEHRVLLGFSGVVALAIVQSWWARRPVPPPKVLGLRQMALGLGLVAVTAIGVALG